MNFPSENLRLSRSKNSKTKLNQSNRLKVMKTLTHLRKTLKRKRKKKMFLKMEGSSGGLKRVILEILSSSDKAKNHLEELLTNKMINHNR